MIGDNYRGLLLGRPFDQQGAKYDEFFTARLQHDVRNSKVSLSLQKLSATFNENSDMLPLLSNVQIIDELCETVRILLDGKQYSNADKVKFIEAKKKKDVNKIPGDPCLSQLGETWVTRNCRNFGKIPVPVRSYVRRT